MKKSHTFAFSFALVASAVTAGSSFAQQTDAQTYREVNIRAAVDQAHAIFGPNSGTAEILSQNSIAVKAVVESAIREGNPKMAEEAGRVPGLKYDDIARLSVQIPGRVQIPDPTARNSANRAISVPGGLVSKECKHFARGYVAKKIAAQEHGLTEEAALTRITRHLEAQPAAYAKHAGKEGLSRSEVATHDADCPICGPLNAAEIACHKDVVKKSPIRELVMFDFSSDVLRGSYVAKIDQIKTLLQADPALKVALIGRASIPGGPVPNFALSAQRITSVWNGMAKAGIPSDRIVAIPIGEDEPHIDLQLAIEYQLDDDFAKFGQQPLNQSVYMVVFKPSEPRPADTTASTTVLAFSKPDVKKHAELAATQVGQNSEPMTEEQKTKLFQRFVQKQTADNQLLAAQ
ncbi:MAG: OmpA family protein [Stappiaceae bacterium]